MKTMPLALVAALMLMAVVGALAQPDPNQPAGKPGGQPAQAVTLSGTVKDVVTPPGGGIGGAVTFNLATDAGDVRVMAAPAAYLAKIGLALKNDMQVTVAGWQKADRKGAVVMARQITADGKTYDLRNEKGNPLWGPFIGVPTITVAGTVKDLVIPAPPQKDAAGQPAGGAKPEAGAEGKPQPAPVAAKGLVSFTLTTEQGAAYRVEVAPPMYLVKIGLTLENGAQVSVTGWKAPGPKRTTPEAAPIIVVQTITVDDNTYTLRDADGRPAGRDLRGGKAGAGGARGAGDAGQKRREQQ